MYDGGRNLLRTHRGLERPDFERIALVLQGGGALGAYQAGVFQALEEARISPDWIAGVSIGAINAALIAGSPPEDRLPALKSFWEEVSREPPWVEWLQDLPRGLLESEDVRGALNHLSALSAFTFGVNGVYGARLMPAWFWPRGASEATGFYDPWPLKAALDRYVDFDRINSGDIRLSVGAVNVRTGNFVYFDTCSEDIRAEHILASAALPPTFPPVEIDGDLYWDGGIVSNTPLDWVVQSDEQHDTLVFQVDLWNTRGQPPLDIAEVITRQKEIQYASRTRASTDSFRRLQRLKNATAEVLAGLPPDQAARPAIRRLAREVERKVFRIVHLIYHARPHQGTTKDFEFSRINTQEHWLAGYHDAVRTLRHPEALARPAFEQADGVATFDIAVDGRQ